MRRSLAPVLACLVVLAGFAALPVVGHGNHLTADAQVVDDHVVVERSFMLQDGYAVVHIDQGGQMGQAIGHRKLSAGPGENYEISVDEAFLSQIDGAARVWVTLHRTDGDGEFEPNQDTPLTGVQGQPPGVVVPIHVSDDGNVNVVARAFGTQRIDEPAATVRRVETNRSGFVVLEDENGTVVGSTPVAAGTTANVTVDLERSFYDSLGENESATLTATVHRDDGDGAFSADDRAMTAGGSPVASDFEVTKVANASRTTSVVVTATGTTVPASKSDERPSTTTDGEAASATGADASDGSPGFGVLATVAAALIATLAVVRRRR